MKNIKYLHIVRGFAAMMVVLAHAKWPFWVGGTVFLQNRSFSALPFSEKVGLLQALISSNGSTMVIVFYVLSGFIISYSYQKNRWTYKQFLLNRAVRIYIPYVASALLAGITLWITFQIAGPLFESALKDYHRRVTVANYEGLTVTNFLKTLVFAKTERINYFGFNYVYWSLLYESIFYLLFPLIIKYYKPVLIVTGIIYPLHFLFNPMPEINYWYFYFSEYLFYFTGGVALFDYLRSKDEIALRQRFIFKKASLRLAMGITFVLVVAGVSERLKDLSFFAASVFGLLWILIIWLYGLQKNWLSKMLLFLGTISYSLYLVHVPLLLFLYSMAYETFGWSIYTSPWFYLLPVLIVIPLAWLFYRIFEKASFNLIAAQKKKWHKPQAEVDFTGAGIV